MCETSCILYDGMKWWNIGAGYYQNLKQEYLHRYIYSKAHGEIPPNHEIHHKNENRLDNRLANLLCIDGKEHQRLHMLKRNAVARFKVEDIQKRSVLCVETGNVYESMEEAAKDVGINRSCISRACSGERKTAKKLHWRYVDAT